MLIVSCCSMPRVQVIAINKDPLGKSAVRIDGSRTWTSLMHRTPLTPPETMWGNGEQLAKPLANGDIAVLLFNRLNTSINIVSCGPKIQSCQGTILCVGSYVRI